MGKIRENWQEYLKKKEWTPINVTVHEELKKATSKKFSIIEADNKISKDTKDWLTVEIGVRSSRNFKASGKAEEREKHEASKEGDSGDWRIGSRFEPRMWTFYYCPEHFRYQFFNEFGLQCPFSNKEGHVCLKTVKKVNALVMLSLPDILTIYLSHYKNFVYVMEKNLELKRRYIDIKNSFISRSRGDIKDITEAELFGMMVEEGFFNWEDLGITIMTFLDETTVWNRAKIKSKNVCMLMATVNENHPSIRMKLRNILPLGGFQTRHGHNCSILDPWAEQSGMLFYSPPKLSLNIFTPELQVKSVCLSAKIMSLGWVIGKKLSSRCFENALKTF